METGKKKARRFVAALTAGCMLAVSLAAVAGADVLSDIEDQQSQLQERQKELEEQREELNEKLEDLKDDEAKQQEYYDSLEEQIQVVMSQIDTANERLTQLDSQILERQEQLKDSQTQLDADFEQLKERLCALYKLGNAGTLEIILSAENLPDMAQKAELMSAITRHDTQLMNSVKSQMEAMADEKAQLEADREEASELRTSLEDRKDELSQLQEESQRVLDELGESQDQISQQISDADAEKEELVQQLSELQKQWLEEKSKATPTPTPTPTPVPTPTPDTGDTGGWEPEPTPTPVTPPSSTGYTWPVPGFNKVGDGWYEGGRAHKGIDIIGAGIYGQPIVAAQSGQVITAYTADTWGYGWGYHVMIGHDDGYATQYAHMSRVAVSTGQYVEKGQIIGYVGNTGDSYGAHLHFELWENGERINPEIVLPYR